MMFDNDEMCDMWIDLWMEESYEALEMFKEIVPLEDDV